MFIEKLMVEKDKLISSEIELIQNTWELVGDSIEMAIDFYNRLFYLYPSLRPLFKEDIRLQARKFTAHMSYLIKNVNEWEKLKPEVEDLGKRHVTYEVQPQHYNYVGEALFYALKIHLKDEWNESTESAWAKFYKMIADRMIGSSFHKN